MLSFKKDKILSVKEYTSDSSGLHKWRDDAVLALRISNSDTGHNVTALHPEETHKNEEMNYTKNAYEAYRKAIYFSMSPEILE